MTNLEDITSGAKRVEELDHLKSSLETPGDLAVGDRGTEDNLTVGRSDTMLGEVTLGMFQRGNSIHVRVGSATNSSELYEGIYESAEEANGAMLRAKILQPAQIANVSEVRVGSATNSSELYEGIYESAEEANGAMLRAKILQPAQIANVSEVVGAGIKLGSVSSQQLQHAGLKQKTNATL